MTLGILLIVAALIIPNMSTMSNAFQTRSGPIAANYIDENGIRPAHENSWQPEHQTTVVNHTGKPLGQANFSLSESWLTATINMNTQNVGGFISYGSHDYEDFAIRQFASETATKGLYDVYLNMRGNLNREIEPMSIVIIVDHSSSMTAERLGKVRLGIENFLNTLSHSDLAPNTVRISYVGYGTNVRTGQYQVPMADLTNAQMTEINHATPTNPPSGEWTNTEAALNQARQILQQEDAGRNKQAILLTDGVPSVSNRITAGTANVEDYKLKFDNQEIRLYDDNGVKSDQFENIFHTTNIYNNATGGTEIPLFTADGKLNSAIFTAKNLANPATASGQSGTGNPNAAATTVSYDFYVNVGAENRQRLTFTLPQVQRATAVFETSIQNLKDFSRTAALPNQASIPTGNFSSPRNFARDENGIPLQYQSNFLATQLAAEKLRDMENIEFHGIGAEIEPTADYPEMSEIMNRFQNMVSRAQTADGYSYFFINAEGGETVANYISSQAVRLTGTVNNGDFVNQIGEQFELNPDFDIETIWFRDGKISDYHNSATIDDNLMTLNNINLSGQHYYPDERYQDEVQIHYQVHIKTENMAFQPDFWYQISNPENTSFNPGNHVRYPFAVPSAKAAGTAIELTKKWINVANPPSNVELLVERSSSNLTDWTTATAILQAQSGDLWTENFTQLTIDGNPVSLAAFDNRGNEITYRLSNELNAEHFNIRFDGNTVENHEKQKLEIFKRTNGFGELSLLSNVSFELSDGEKNVTAVTDENGRLTFSEGLTHGKTYVLTEIAADGHKISGPWTIETSFDGAQISGENLEFDENAQRILLTIDNEFIEKSVGIVKFDDDENLLDGAKFSLRDEHHEIAQLDGNGENFDGLKAGKYTISELEAPVGFVKNPDDFNFELTIDGRFLDENGNEISDEPTNSGFFVENDVLKFALQNRRVPEYTELALEVTKFDRDYQNTMNNVRFLLEEVYDLPDFTRNFRPMFADLTENGKSLISDENGILRDENDEIPQLDFGKNYRLSMVENRLGFPQITHTYRVNVPEMADYVYHHELPNGAIRDENDEILHILQPTLTRLDLQNETNFRYSPGIVKFDVYSGIQWNFNFRKVDGNQPENGLSAQFALSTYQGEIPYENDFNELNELDDNFVHFQDFTTDENGNANFPELNRGTLYKISELEAPAGFERTEAQVLLYYDEDLDYHIHVALPAENGRLTILPEGESEHSSALITDGLDHTATLDFYNYRENDEEKITEETNGNDENDGNNENGSSESGENQPNFPNLEAENFPNQPDLTDFPFIQPEIAQPDLINVSSLQNQPELNVSSDEDLLPEVGAETGLTIVGIGILVILTTFWLRSSFFIDKN